MKRFVFGFLLVILISGMIGCAGSEAYTPSPIIGSTGKNGAVTYTIAPAPAAQGLSGIFDRGSGSSEQAPSPVITVAPPTTPAGSPSVSYYSQNGDVTWSTASERMIIRNGSMQLVVTDIAEAIKKITELSGTYGGYVVTSSIQENQSRLYGNISIRVLSDRFNDALISLRALAEDVKAETTSGNDVTEEYTDLSSKLRNLQAAEAQLLELMKQAGKVTEILEVQKELTNTRSEIEQIKGRMQYLEQSSSLALIQVTLEQSKLTIEFNATARNIREGEKIYLVPTISGGFQPYSYQWDFGDGQTSTEGAPQHAYKKNGTYTVSLKVTDDHGNTTSLKRDSYITVITGWEAGNTAHSAWSGAVGFMHFLVDAIVWLALWSWFWIPVLAIVLYFTWWRKRRKAKQNK